MFYGSILMIWNMSFMEKPQELNMQAITRQPKLEIQHFNSDSRINFDSIFLMFCDSNCLLSTYDSWCYVCMHA